MFRKKEPQFQPPTSKTDYPSGVAIETEAGVFYVRGGKRYRIPTDRIRDSWAFVQIVPSTEAAAKHLKVAGTLGFRDGTHVVDVTDGRNYLISDNKKRLIVDPDVWTNLGLKPELRVWASQYEVNLHTDGEVLR